MKRMMKRILSVIFAVVMVLGSVPLAEIMKAEFGRIDGLYGFMTAFSSLSNTKAEATSISGYYEYIVEGENAAIYKADKQINGNVVVPSAIDGYTVTEISDEAFRDCRNLTGITIPDSVEHIGNRAFYDCDNLIKINLHNDITTIGKDAFCYSGYYNNISNWDNNVLYIDNYLIKARTTLSGKYVVREDTTTIADSAFSGCEELTDILLPESVTRISDYLFYGCTKLNDVDIHDKITSIGEYAFCNCEGLNNVTVGNGVTYIDDWAFYDCDNIQSVLIGSSVTDIGTSAFRKCQKLIVVILGSNVKYIREYAFCDCVKLSGITLTDRVISLGDYSFYNCESMTEVVFSDKVTTLGEYSFSRCKGLTEINLPDSITSLGESAFYFCTKLDKVKIGAGIKNIGHNAFESCYDISETRYRGTLQQWDRVEIEGGNYYLTQSLIFDSNYSKPYYGGYLSYDNLVWKLYEDGVLEITGTGSIKNFSYSSKAPWYTLRLLINSVKINDGIEYIGSNAFESCCNLTSLSIGKDVKSIGTRAFEGCTSLVTLDIGDGVTEIGSYAFSGCSSLESVHIPSGIKTIGDYAFKGCSLLKSVVYKDTDNAWKAVDKGTFDEDLTYLISYKSSSSGSYYADGYSGIVYWILYTDGTLVFKGSGTMSNYSYYSLPPWYEYRHLISSVRIDSTTERIGSYAFYDCDNISSMTVPSSVKNIGAGAFLSCDGLESVHIPYSVSSIGTDAFSSSGLDIVYFESSKTKFDSLNFFSSACAKQSVVVKVDYKSNDAYYTGKYYNLSWDYYPKSNKLQINGTGAMVKNLKYPWKYKDFDVRSVEISEGITSIPDYAFSDLGKLYYVGLPNGIEKIEKDAFVNSKIYNTFLNSEESALYIGRYFIKCKASLENECIVDDGTLLIADSAFENCHSLVSVSIPNSVLNIGDSAFRGCSKIINLAIPTSLKTIGESAFSDCSGLTSMTIPSTVTKIGNSAFNGCFELANLTNSASVTTIGESVFNGCLGLTSITIPPTVTTIEKSAFDGCSGLVDLVIPLSVTVIGDSAFSGCSKITRLEIPESVTSIGDYAFSGCSGITSLTIPASITTISQSAFCGCLGLTSLSISKTLLTVKAAAFKNCISLSDVYYSEQKKKWENIKIEKDNDCLLNANIHFNIDSDISYVFDETTGELFVKGFGAMTDFESVTDVPWKDFDVKSIVIEEGVTHIADFSFDGISSITEVTIPESVKSIGDNAFRDCYGLVKVNCVGTYTEWKLIRIGLNNDFADAEFMYCCNSERPNMGEGICGENVFWILYCDYELVIFGSGEMYDYSNASSVPWKNNFSLIKRINIEEGVTSIGGYAFSGCKATEVDLPKSITKIGEEAFGYCFNLKEAYYYGDVADWCSIKFTNSLSNPCCYAEFLNINGQPITGYLVVPDGVISINDYAFRSYSQLTSVKIPESVENVGKGAFAYCENLEKVNFSVGIKTINEYAFSNCGKLADVYYEGTKEDWSLVKVEKNNNSLAKATIHMNPSLEESTTTSPYEETTTKPAVTQPSTTRPGEETTTKPAVTQPSTTRLGEEMTTKPAVTQPSTTRPEEETTTKPAVTQPSTTGSEEEITNPSIPYYKEEDIVKTPSTSVVVYGDSIVLHIDASKIPAGSRVEWTASNNNFSYSVNGATCTITPNKKGDTTFTATVYDVNGNAVLKDEQIMTSKAGFFDKIIAFFKKIFGLTKTIPQIYKGVF